MKALTPLIALLIAFQPAFAAETTSIKDNVQPAKLEAKIRKQIAKAVLNKTIPIVEGDIFDGVSVALKYRYRLEPSYKDSFYTRIDRWAIQADVNPGDIIEELGSPIGFGIHKDSEVLFARQFKSQKEGAIAMPYGIERLPITANRALKMLQVGDFVALKANLAFTLSASLGKVLMPQFSASSSAGLIVAGDFQVHMYKINDTKVRLKFIAAQNNGKNIGVHVGADTKLKIIGVSVVDKKITDFVNLNVLDINGGKNKQDVFLIDYVFDLSKPEVAAIYDNLLSKKVTFKDLQLLNPLRDKKEIAEMLLNDLSEVERVSEEDEDLAKKERRISRIFKGASYGSGHSSNFKVGMNLMRLQKGNAQSSNQIVSYDEDNNQTRYTLSTSTSEYHSTFLFKLFDAITSLSTQLLLKVNDTGTPTEFTSLTFTREFLDNNFTQRNAKKVFRHLSQNVPSDVNNEIELSKWLAGSKTKINAALRSYLVFHREAFKSLPAMSPSKIEAKLREFLNSIPGPRLAVSSQNTQGIPDGSPVHQVALEPFSNEVETIARGLSVALNDAEDPVVRGRAINSLLSMTLFKEVGGGFIWSLIPEEARNEGIFFKFEASAKDYPVYTYKYGSDIHKELYDSIFSISTTLTNRSYDMGTEEDEY